MKIEIDQSGKIEQTNLDTIVALSNDIQMSVLLKKSTKRQLQTYFIEIGKIDRFATTVFSLCLAYLLKDYSKPGRIVVDREYNGHEVFVSQQLDVFRNKLSLGRKWHIEFGHVGKTSKAHMLASHISKKKKQPTTTLTLKDCLLLLQKRSTKK